MAVTELPERNERREKKTTVTIDLIHVLNLLNYILLLTIIKKLYPIIFPIMVVIINHCFTITGRGYDSKYDHHSQMCSHER